MSQSDSQDSLPFEREPYGEDATATDNNQSSEIAERTPSVAKPKDKIESLLTQRYREAHQVAKVATAFGSFFQGVGVLALAIGVLFLIGSLTGGGISGVFILPSLGLALLGIIVWIMGILVSASGQCLKALLDTALNTSPLLSNSQKSAIMLKEPNE